jgi:FHA domain-containing protein
MVPAMADRDDRMRRPARAPVRATTRRKWVLAGVMSGLWLLLLFGSGSLVLATVLLVVLTVLAAACVIGLRSLGIDGDHPWVQRMSERPWRDGRDVLQQGLRHMPELFLVAPSGSLLAPNVVELHMNPDDLASLTDMMDLDLINSSAAEVYQGYIADSGARLGSDGPVEVWVVGDPAVPAGRYRVRQGRPVSAAPLVSAGLLQSAGLPHGPGQPRSMGQPLNVGHPVAAGQPVGLGHPVGAGQAVGAGQPVGLGHPVAAGQYPVVPPPDAGPLPDAARPVSAVIGGRRVPFNPHDGYTQNEGAGVRSVVTDMVTVAEAPAIPALRLITNGSVAETRQSGANAGRASTSELVLPAEPTVSRVHAKFVFTKGQWWITSLGRNGVMLNGVPVTGERPVSDGDVIGWGAGPEALMSRVQIVR